MVFENFAIYKFRVLNAGLWFLSQIRFRRRFLHRGTGLAVESLSIAECPLLPGRAELARKYDHVSLLVATYKYWQQIMLFSLHLYFSSARFT